MVNACMISIYFVLILQVRKKKLCYVSYVQVINYFETNNEMGSICSTLNNIHCEKAAKLETGNYVPLFDLRT